MMRSENENGSLLPACFSDIILITLGNRLAVGQRTLDPPGKVRILLPQPVKKLSELLFEKKSLIPALQQILNTCH